MFSEKRSTGQIRDWIWAKQEFSVMKHSPKGVLGKYVKITLK
jgi:hypothetical protein